MSNPKIKKILEVKFIGDEDVLKHISEDAGIKVRKTKVLPTLDIKKLVKKTEDSSEEEDPVPFKEQGYVSNLGTVVQGSLRNGCNTGGGDVFTFQTPKRSNKMAETASELAQNLGRNLTKDNLMKHENEAQSKSKGQEEKSRRKVCISNTPYRLRKRITGLNMCSDSESDYSASCSEEEEEESCSKSADATLHTSAHPNKETPAKKPKPHVPSDLVEEYFEAHSSSKVLTSDRTLQKIEKKKLDQESLQNILNKVPVAFAAEREALTNQYKTFFYKWMLQLHLGFNILLYGLGSKRDLLENFRISLLQDCVHIVVNGFFPNVNVKSILNSITEEVLDCKSTFRSPQDQLDMVMTRFKEDPSLELYLLIHNLDSQMLRGDKSQQILGQLSSLPNVYLIASIDHINAPLMWDQAKQSMYNWLWYETTTYSPYIEETSYENSLLIQRSGSLALSSLTHVLHSLTPNARGIFRLLGECQLENKDNPSWPGLSFQELYQHCREAFLVNSDLSLRAQLTEFRDHKLIRTKRSADGVEYLLIPVDMGTLAEFLQKDNEV
ncbi:origin recognition complex subunit 2 [Anolis sagrei]|uniref:origin recognition complex subunit 2 n=1 Tax=Anolis sagrei TaxID=38937 RepID=UPI003520019F